MGTVVSELWLECACENGKFQRAPFTESLHGQSHVLSWRVLTLRPFLCVHNHISLIHFSFASLFLSHILRRDFIMFMLFALLQGVGCSWFAIV